MYHRICHGRLMVREKADLVLASNPTGTAVSLGTIVVVGNHVLSRADEDQSHV